MQVQDEILQKLNNIESMLLEQSTIKKDVLNFNEACRFLSVSSSHLYKLTSASKIPHYKPEGKRVFFNRTELTKWLLRNRVRTNDEIENEAIKLVTIKN